MVKLTKREWDIMKRPIYPNMQIVGDGSTMLVQTMVHLKDGYFYPVVLKRRVPDAMGLIELGEVLLKELENISKMEINEDDKLLFKVEM